MGTYYFLLRGSENWLRCKVFLLENLKSLLSQISPKHRPQSYIGKREVC